jgi:uncharacterized protein YcbK (DUF882 family)
MTPEASPMNPPLYDRRRALGLGLATVFTLAAGPGLARPSGARALSIQNLHTDEMLSVAYWEEGHYVPGALKELNRILRDHRTDEVCDMDPGLFDLLHRVRERLRTTAPFQIISGYRSPVTNATLAKHSRNVARNSLHTQGLAVDIRVPGRSVRDLRNAALSLEAGGVGYYPGRQFVHLDVGPVRSW